MPTEKEASVRLFPSCMMGILVASTLALFFLGYSAADVDGTSKDHQATIEESSTEYSSSNDVDTSSSNVNHDKKRITVLGLHDILDLKRSDIFGLGKNDHGNVPPRLNYNQLHANDMIEDSFFDPISPDPSCVGGNDENDGGDCWNPPDSTVEEEIVQECDDGTTTTKKSAGLETLPWGYGGADPDDDIQDEQEEECVEETAAGEDGNEGDTDKKKCKAPSTTKPDSGANLQCAAPKSKFVDKHWGSDINVLKMRDQLRGRRGKYWDMTEPDINNATKIAPKPQSEKNKGASIKDKRPPVFLLPGLASTRLVSWKHKPCPQNALLSDIKMLDYVWMNMNLLLQMATIDAKCWNECMTLGKYQSDYDGEDDDNGGTESSHGCKLRPDEGLDAISSLAPGSTTASLLVGGTNTVYAWLIQWLADNLGYDVTSIVALPYDWRLSPDVMESRDGFLTMTKKKIEAAVEANGRPGIMVAHSMGNSVFRYFLKWLRVQMREKAYERYVQQAKVSQASASGGGPFWRRPYMGMGLNRRLVNNPGEDDILENHEEYTSDGGSDHTTEQNIKEEDEGSINEEEEESGNRAYPKLYAIAKVEADSEWLDWIGKHIWTYVGLAAPLLGAPGPLRSVISGENMGLPFTDEEARVLELSFGSTLTVNPISTKMGFCDGEVGRRRGKETRKKSTLACLEELVSGIESSKDTTDPWKDFPALRLILKDRVDYSTIFPPFKVEREYCMQDETSPCNNQTVHNFGAREMMNGKIFDQLSQIWNEKGNPLGEKLNQLRHSWWHTGVPNMLDTTPDRPHIKHVIMAYGTDVSTEVGYVYRKSEKFDSDNTTILAKDFDEMPTMSQIIREEQNGRLVVESLNETAATFTETILRKKKEKRHPLKTDDGKTPQWLHHSGDGTIPYISLMWAHTWLLHATMYDRRAMRHSDSTNSMLEGERISNPKNALDSIKVSHRPKGGNEWVQGYGADPREGEEEEAKLDDDTGTSHPHGTKYKPKMVRFQSSGRSRSTGMEYTTTVIEAIGVEHKETTRNYDILAAAFTDVLNNLHNDYGLIEE